MSNPVCLPCFSQHPYNENRCKHRDVRRGSRVCRAQAYCGRWWTKAVNMKADSATASHGICSTDFELAGRKKRRYSPSSMTANGRSAKLPLLALLHEIWFQFGLGELGCRFGLTLRQTSCTVRRSNGAPPNANLPTRASKYERLSNYPNLQSRPSSTSNY